MSQSLPGTCLSRIFFLSSSDNLLLCSLGHCGRISVIFYQNNKAGTFSGFQLSRNWFCGIPHSWSPQIQDPWFKNYWTCVKQQNILTNWTNISFFEHGLMNMRWEHSGHRSWNFDFCNTHRPTNLVFSFLAFGYIKVGQRFSWVRERAHWPLIKAHRVTFPFLESKNVHPDIIAFVDCV